MRGFTIIELLLVVSVIVVLLALLVPSLVKARERVRATYCLANVKAIGAAFYYYTTDNNGFVTPRAIGGSADGNFTASFSYTPRVDGTVPGAYWSDQILLGQYSGSTNGDNTKPRFMEGAVSKRSPFICPSDRQHEPPNYEEGRVSYGMGANFTSVTAGTLYTRMWKLGAALQPANEIVIVDSLTERTTPGGWAEPYMFYGVKEPLRNGNWDELSPTSYYNWSRRHMNGANVLFVDGHASYVEDLKKAYDGGELTCHRID